MSCVFNQPTLLIYTSLIFSSLPFYHPNVPKLVSIYIKYIYAYIFFFYRSVLSFVLYPMSYGLSVRIRIRIRPNYDYLVKIK